MPDARIVEAIVAALVATPAAAIADEPIILGLCGAQGSGKSTLAAALARRLGAAGLTTALLSLDDLYKTRADRLAMASRIHPLFRTRGVPGTHDLALGLEVCAALRARRAIALPRFDKAIDDRADPATWPALPPETRVLILEGWFVGARPQADEALIAPLNDLEREEDSDGRWRRHANAALADYQSLFDQIDMLVLLAAPSFDVVQGWRAEQEQKLRRTSGGGMSDAEIGRFVAHYERLTRHILRELPDRADLVVRLDEHRAPLEISAGSCCKREYVEADT